MKPRWIIGADEVGTGCLAGPLAVCAFAAPVNWKPPPKLNDSKKLSAGRRNELASALSLMPTVIYKITQRSAKEIDAEGIRPALQDAFVEAIRAVLGLIPGRSVPRIVIDGDMRFNAISHGDTEGWISVVGADGSVPAVSAASVLAKVYRDHLMSITPYKRYGFEKHKGYGTPEHLAAIALHGPCSIHRMTFAPLTQYCPTE